MPALDLATSVAASVLQTAHHKGNLVRLVTGDGPTAGSRRATRNSSRCSSCSRCCSRAEHASINRALDRAATQVRNGGAVVITPETDPAKLADIQRLGRGFAAVVLVMLDVSAWDPDAPEGAPSGGRRIVRISRSAPFRAGAPWHARPRWTVAGVDATHGRSRATSRPSAEPTRLLLGCELALVGVTASIIVGFGRLFVDWSFLPELLLLGAASHGLAILVRRMGRGVIVSALVSLAGLIVVGSIALYADTTAARSTDVDHPRRAAQRHLERVGPLRRGPRAGTEVHPGFVAAAGIAVWLVAFLSDWAAFRLWSPLEAVAPAAIVFLFCSLQRAEEYEAMSTALFAAAVLIFILLHRLARQDSGASWLATEPGKGRNAIVRVGSVVGAAAIVTGLVVGPALPGAGEEAVVPWRDIGEGDEDDSRVTVRRW